MAWLAWLSLWALANWLFGQENRIAGQGLESISGDWGALSKGVVRLCAVLAGRRFTDTSLYSHPPLRFYFDEGHPCPDIHSCRLGGWMYIDIGFATIQI